MQENQQKPEIITKYYGYLIWLMQRTAKFSRNYKYSFGKRIENNALQILEDLIKAYYQKDKINILREINLKLEILRYLIRLANDLELISLKQFQFSVNALSEIGKQIGGWIRQTNKI